MGFDNGAAGRTHARKPWSRLQLTRPSPPVTLMASDSSKKCLHRERAPLGDAAGSFFQAIQLSFLPSLRSNSIF